MGRTNWFEIHLQLIRINLIQQNPGLDSRGFFMSYFVALAMRNRRVWIFSILGLVVFLPWWWSGKTVEISNTERIHGFNLVAPPRPFPVDSLMPIQALGAKWVAVVPYAFCNPTTGEITYDHPRQWWGERKEGIVQSIAMAQSLGLKVMLKPHLWVGGQGWAGDLSFATDSLWMVWETQYLQYINQYLHVADSMDVELFCLGTEIRNSSKNRPEFWIKLIKSSRSKYSGLLTYAANWDEFQDVSFWSELDLIGVDAYFPLSIMKEPTKENLVKAWQAPIKEMAQVAKKYKRPILFTEYGYESIGYVARGHWEINKDTLEADFQNQAIAFQALYESLSPQTWWAGGLIWKWHPHQSGLEPRTIKTYTPQHKPALEVIGREFGIR
jgi:hypothetical protein